jgi:hypothetical protein
MTGRFTKKIKADFRPQDEGLSITGGSALCGMGQSYGVVCCLLL